MKIIAKVSFSSLSGLVDELQVLNGTGDPEDLTQNARNFQELVMFEPYEKCQEQCAATRSILNKLYISYVLLSTRADSRRCLVSGWNDDMDLIGIGVCSSTSSALGFLHLLMARQVFASYYTEAILVTLFLFSYSFWHIQQHRTMMDSKPSLLGPRTLRAFQYSTKGFLDAAKVSSVAMLFAAVYISAEGVAQRQDNAAKGKYGPVEITHGSILYDMMLSMVASTFSIFPVLILYTIQRRHATDSLKTTGRPTWFGRIILALIWMLGVMEAFLSLYGNFDYDSRHESSKFAKENCDWRSTTYWTGMRAAQVLLCPLHAA